MSALKQPKCVHDYYIKQIKICKQRREEHSAKKKSETLSAKLAIVGLIIFWAVIVIEPVMLYARGI